MSVWSLSNQSLAREMWNCQNNVGSAIRLMRGPGVKPPRKSVKSMFFSALQIQNFGGVGWHFCTSDPVQGFVP